MTPFQQEIRKVLEELCENTMGNPPYRYDKAIQALLSLVRGIVPKEKDKCVPKEDVCRALNQREIFKD